MNSLYSITITNNGNTVVPTEGFIDNLTIPQYLALGSAGPSSVAAGLAKARANYRYKMLCQQLSLMTNIYTINLNPVGGDCNTAPSSFSFTAVVEHGDSSLYFYDETQNNLVVADPIASLVRYVARALIAAETTELMYIDPTATAAPGNSEVYMRKGPTLQTEVIGPVVANMNLTTANGLITVTKIA